MSPPATAAAVPVRSGMAGYEVIVEVGGLARLPALLRERAPAHRYVVVSDARVAVLHARAFVERCRAAGLDTGLLTFPAGEASKTRAEWARLTDAMLDMGCGRDSCVVAMGGGVTTDLGGFVAATYMRGVPLVQVPTSYLAMIDASVGSKTGVDVPAGKNLVGAFHAPNLVLADPDLLGTLAPEERAQGLVEAFKHGAILDEAYFSELAAGAAALLEARPAAARDVVLHSVRLKGEVVTDDERERGRREILNFGHTVGHALEAASDYAVAHGSAVAAGMLLEAELGTALGVTEPGTTDVLDAGLATLRLPPLPAVDLDRVLGLLAADKKARAGRPRWVLLERIGRVARGEPWSREVSEALVAEVVARRLTPDPQRPGGFTGP